MHIQKDLQEHVVVFEERKASIMIIADNNCSSFTASIKFIQRLY